MRYGFVLPGGPPTMQIEQAVLAEEAGWDGVFAWEAGYGTDPWTLLAAIAMRTERLRLGTMLTPLPWRRPWKLASQVVTLDQVSAGRAILTVGLGALDSALGSVGEVADLRTRARLLDEGIDVITALWEGDGRYDGDAHKVDFSQSSALGPLARPVQSPRVPIWCVGAFPRPRSMRRVLRCDGVVPAFYGDDGMREGSPDDIREMIEWLDANGGRRPGFDVIWEGETPADDPAAAAARVQPWGEAGCTWWMETRWMAPRDDPAEADRVVRERLRAGPPRG
jgi:alkanesulfonate monooxygenase SsuD/methylene tetrahydromethanopterin reductase-like flavin-dependent oxidoreductase (luciferase family)